MCWCFTNKSFFYHLIWWISEEFEKQSDRNLYVYFKQLLLALKLKLVKGHGCETYRTMKSKKCAKRNQGLLHTSICGLYSYSSLSSTSICIQSFYEVYFYEVYINDGQLYKSNGLYARLAYKPTNFKRALSEHKVICTLEVITAEKPLMRFKTHT